MPRDGVCDSIWDACPVIVSRGLGVASACLCLSALMSLHAALDVHTRADGPLMLSYVLCCLLICRSSNLARV